MDEERRIKKVGPWRKLKSIISIYDTEPTEIILGVSTALYGLWLLAPWETFENSSIFGVMSQIAPEPAWGLLLLFLGSFHLYKLLTNGRKWRRRTSFWMYLLWLFMFLFTFMFNPSSLAPVAYLIFSTKALWIYLRLRG